MSQIYRLLFITLFIFSMGGCATVSNGTSGAPYRITSDQVQGWSMNRDGLRWKLTVPAEPGFGRLTLQPLSITPKPDLVIHLPLTNLEQISVSYADRQFMAGFSRSGFFHDVKCDSCPDPDSPALRLVVITRTNQAGEADGYDLYLPADYWQLKPGAVNIQWIDWLRQ